MKKILLLAVVVVLAMFMLTACAPDAPPATGNGTSTEGGETPGGGATGETAGTGGASADTHLIVVQPMMPSQLDPTMANEVPQSRANYLIFQTLVYQWEGEIIPGLATSWDFVDPQTVVFTIREGVKFHDGSTLTPDDVVFSINRASVSPHVSIITDMIAEATVVGDNQVQVTTEFAFAPILNHLAHSATSIVSREVVERIGDNEHTLNPVGTGPFRLYSMVAGDHFELVRFDDFSSVVPGLPEGQLPELERITFRIVPEGSVRAIELETGAAHVLVDVAAADVSRLRNLNDVNMLEVPNWALNTWLGFNNQRAPFDDIRVRQAIAYTIDIPTIVDVAWAGVGRVASGPLPNTVPGYTSFPPITQNIERARELMAEAGLADGFEADIWTNEGNPMRADAATMIQAQLRALNIETTVRIYEWGVLLPGTAAGEHSMSLMGWTTATGDPDYGLYPVYHSSNWGAGGNRNFYSNPRVDALLDQGRMETNTATRMEIYREAQELIMADLPLVPLWQAAELQAARTNVNGFTVTPFGGIPFWLVSIS